jgi:hypothetical protein
VRTSKLDDLQDTFGHPVIGAREGKNTVSKLDACSHVRMTKKIRYGSIGEGEKSAGRQVEC